MSDEGKVRIAICLGSSCFARGNERNLAAIEAFMESRGLGDRVALEGLRCLGQCRRGPNIEIDGRLYHRVDADTVVDLLTEHLQASTAE